MLHMQKGRRWRPFCMWSMWDLILVSLRKQAALRAGKGRQMAAFLYVEYVEPFLVSFQKQAALRAG